MRTDRFHTGQRAGETGKARGSQGGERYVNLNQARAPQKKSVELAKK